MNGVSWISVFTVNLCVLFCLCSSASSEQGRWQARSFPRRWHPGITAEQQSGDSDLLQVENEVIRVTFDGKNSWKLGEVFFRGKEIVGKYGSNSSVLSVERDAPWERPQAGWLGSGHGGEKLQGFRIEADEKTLEFTGAVAVKGRELRVIKKSEMGPFIYTQTFIFPAEGDHVVQDHNYRVFRDPEGFRFMYAFMHCNTKGLDAWLAVLPDSSRLEGMADKGDNSNHLKQEIISVAFYDETSRKGVSYSYPEAYRGSAWKHFIWDRPGDTKYYFRPYIPSSPEIGSEFNYRVKLTPFSADPGDWKEKAEKLSEF